MKGGEVLHAGCLPDLDKIVIKVTAANLDKPPTTSCGYTPIGSIKNSSIGLSACNTV